MIYSESNKPTEEKKPDPAEEDDDEAEQTRLVQQSAYFLKMFEKLLSIVFQC